MILDVGYLLFLVKLEQKVQTDSVEVLARFAAGPTIQCIWRCKFKHLSVGIGTNDAYISEYYRIKTSVP